MIHHRLRPCAVPDRHHHAGDDVGTLGDGTTINRSVPAPVSGLSSGVTAIAAGQNSSYALSSDGSIWAWGDNTFAGELGIGTTINQLTPQHLLPPDGYLFDSIAANGDANHVFATLTATPEPACLSVATLSVIALFARRRTNPDRVLSR